MKLKTHKTTAKKIKMTHSKRNKKFLTKKSGQDHFNARESGEITRNKRRRVTTTKANIKNIKRSLPYY